MLIAISCLSFALGLACAQTNPAPPVDPQRQLVDIMQPGDIEGVKALLAQQRQYVMSKAEVAWREIADGIQQNLNVPFNPAWKTTYGYNAALSGLKFEQIEDPSKVVAFADCTSKDRLIHSLADIDATRHDGQCLVAFVDGNIAYVPAVEVARLMLKP